MKFEIKFNKRSQSIGEIKDKNNLIEKIPVLVTDRSSVKIINALGYNERTKTSEISKRKVFQKKLHKQLKEFDQEHKQKMKTYHEFKAENDKFMSKFKQKEILSDAHNFNKTQFNKIDQTFHDLILKYKEKGYKIPNLTVQKNLFRRSPLLLENYQIKDFYKFLKKGEADSHEVIHFLNKINTLLIEKMKTHEPDIDSIKKKMMDRKLTLFRRLTIGANILKEQIKDTKEIQKEIDENLAYSETLRQKFKEETEDNLQLSRNKSSNNFYIKNKDFCSIESDINKNTISITTKTDNFFKSLNKESQWKSRNMSHNFNYVEKSHDSKLSSNKNKSTKYVTTNMMSSFLRENISDNNTFNQTLNSKFMIPNVKSSYLTNKNLKSKLKPNETSLKNKNNSQIELKSERSEFFKPNVQQEEVEVNKYNHRINNNQLHTLKITPNAKNKKLTNRPDIKKFGTEANSTKRTIDSNSSNSKHFGKDEFTLAHFNNKYRTKGLEIVNEREKFLSWAYDKINNHENVNIKDTLNLYSKKFLHDEENNIDEVLNKKIEPIHLMKSISKLKSKANLLNVPEMYKTTYSVLGKLDSTFQNINRISEYDNQISKLDLELAKKMNKLDNPE